jgi:hypothetical protein
MTSPRVCKRGYVTTSALVMVASLMALTGGSAKADFVFRKKPPAATDQATDDSSPSGGEPGAEAAAVPAATAPQSEDKDYPELQADKEKKAADAALAREARKAQLDREKEKGTPIYDKWEFWAITGAVVVGAVLTIWGGSAILHQMNGGDIQGCPMTATDRCFGQGR